MKILIILIVFFSQNVFATLVLASKDYEKSRIIIPIMGDGYQFGEQEAFRGHAEKLIDELLQVEPFNTYANFFDFKIIEVISNDSGVSNDPEFGIKKDTALNVRFMGRSMRVDSEAVIKQMLAKFYIVIANSDNYGGATYMKSNILILPGFSPYSAKILVHEMGHLIGRLADEYAYTDKTYTKEEPKHENLTIQSYDQMLENNTKWGRWLGYPGIDLYEGGDDYKYGIFRPTFKSNMNSYDYGFSVVNKEQLIKKIYEEEIGTIDKCTQVGNRAFVYARKKGNVEIKWFIDDQRVEGVNHYLDVDRSGVIKALVIDDTEDVRDEEFRESNMSSVCIWDSYQGSGGVIDIKFLLIILLVAFGPPLFNAICYYFVRWIHTQYKGYKE